jgi:chaperone BCS1
LTLRVQSRDPEVSLALLSAISEAGCSKKETPKVFVFHWNWVSTRPCPTGRAAILPDGEYSALARDLRDFLEAESWYREVGLPYRRGYLLHGIPGSGKTTTVAAIAGDFGFNVCVISLNSHDDASLLEAVRIRPANSLLLLEDIDCAFEKRENKDGKELSFSGLLNVLDGVATPDGSIVFMTTNRRGKLDQALIRPGRVDKEVEFKTARPEQIAELTRRFSRNGPGDVPVSDWAAENISMATVQERLIQRYRAPATGVRV